MPDQPTQMKPGWRTSEFYVTLFAAMTPLFTAIFHKDFSGDQIQAWATVAAAIATSAYAISRAHSKRAMVQANAMIASGALIQPQQPASSQTQGSAPVTSSLGNATIPLDMLVLILNRLDEIAKVQISQPPEKEPLTTA